MPKIFLSVNIQKTVDSQAEAVTLFEALTGKLGDQPGIKVTGSVHAEFESIENE